MGATEFRSTPKLHTEASPCTHQAGGLEARGGCVNAPHPGDGLVVVDEPLGVDLHVW